MIVREKERYKNLDLDVVSTLVSKICFDSFLNQLSKRPHLAVVLHVAFGEISYICVSKIFFEI